MPPDFSTYEAYLDRYRTFWSDVEDQRLPLLSEEDFNQNFRLLGDSYRTYREMVHQGMEEEAAHYYTRVINPLENELAIADGFNNFLGIEDLNQFYRM